LPLLFAYKPILNTIDLSTSTLGTTTGRYQMARPADLDLFVFDKVSSNVADTPAAEHIAQSTPEPGFGTPPGLNIAPPTTGALDHFTSIDFPGLPEAATDHGHPPGWLLGPI
jgi:hypothetical protein